MANEIGNAIEVPNSPLDPRKQQPFVPPPEVQKDPKFQAIGEWLKQPQNAMTALVLVGAMAQDRRRGQSKQDAFFERALGTLGFRGELQRLDQGDKDAAAVRESEMQHRKDQVGVAREQVQATRENTAADERAARAATDAQLAMSAEGNETRRYIAELQAATDAQIAQLVHGQENANLGAIMSIEDINAANDLYKASLDSDAPMTFGDALKSVLAPRLAIMALSGDPAVGKILQIFEGPPQVTPATAMPTETPRPPVERRSSSGTRSVPQPIPAFGLPNPMLGQSYGPGPHEAPPANSATRPPMMYPGTK